MAVKFFEKPVNTEEFEKLKNFEMFKKDICSKDIYMKIPEVWVKACDGVFPKNSILIYGHYKIDCGYIYVCGDTTVFPVKSEIQIYE